MRLRYSKEADALYIRFRDGEVDHSQEITEDLILDYDLDGSLLAIEVLFASEKTNVEEMIFQTFKTVTLEKSFTPQN